MSLIKFYQQRIVSIEDRNGKRQLQRQGQKSFVQACVALNFECYMEYAHTPVRSAN
jgi:hypothetical protein